MGPSPGLNSVWRETISGVQLASVRTPVCNVDLFFVLLSSLAILIVGGHTQEGHSREVFLNQTTGLPLTFSPS